MSGGKLAHQKGNFVVIAPFKTNYWLQSEADYYPGVVLSTLEPSGGKCGHKIENSNIIAPFKTNDWLWYGDDDNTLIIFSIWVFSGDPSLPCRSVSTPLADVSQRHSQSSKWMGIGSFMTATRAFFIELLYPFKRISLRENIYISIILCTKFFLWISVYSYIWSYWTPLHITRTMTDSLVQIKHGTAILPSTSVPTELI